MGRAQFKKELGASQERLSAQTRSDRTPLIGRVALHAHQLQFEHSAHASPVTITAPWPEDLTVAVKHLRRFAA